MRLFSYKIYYINEENFKDTIHEQGITSAATHKDAVSNITEFYGDDCIIELTITELDNIIRFPKDIHTKIEEDDFFGQKTYEKGERVMIERALEGAFKSAGISFGSVA